MKVKVWSLVICKVWHLQRMEIYINPHNFFDLHLRRVAGLNFLELILILQSDII